MEDDTSSAEMFVHKYPPDFTPIRSGCGLGFGWGCGYVIVPAGHVAYGYCLKESKNLFVVEPVFDVHGKVTFCRLMTGRIKEKLEKFFSREFPENSILIGFDTAHPGDTIENWSEEHVVEETRRLLKQVNEFDQPIVEESMTSELKEKVEMEEAATVLISSLFLEDGVF